MPGDATVSDAGGVPAHWITLRGLAPPLIQVGTVELLLSDSEELGRSSTASGVDVTTTVREGLPHVYQAMADTPEAAEAADQAGAFLRDKTGRAG